MFRTLQVSLSLFAWLLATGAQWDILQVIAWSNMFLTNTATMSVGAALEKTFDGEECELCTAVREAKQQESSPGLPTTKKPAKLTLVFQSVPAFIYSVELSNKWAFVDEVSDGRMRAAPPLPPPRAGLSV